MPEGQIEITGAGLPGAVDSDYSGEITLVAVGTESGSPPSADDIYTVIPQVGWIMFEDLPTDVSIVIKTGVSTYATLIAASAQGQTWSDATNVFAKNTSGADANVKYFVVGHKS